MPEMQMDGSRKIRQKPPKQDDPLLLPEETLLLWLLAGWHGLQLRTLQAQGEKQMNLDKLIHQFVASLNNIEWRKTEIDKL